MAEICTLSGIEKRYTRTGTPSLGPLTLTLEEGEILGVRGANGAGKSTLLGLLAGVLRPDAGSRVCAPGVEGHIGYVPQELSLYNSLTGLENLRFWGLAAGLPGRVVPTRSRWLLQLVELTDKAKARVETYSGGMKRRLHLASALMIPPRLLLLDEPTVGADAHSVEVILATLRHLRGQGCTTVLISHHDGELRQVCTRVITLKEGRLAGEASL